jgi:hypothetical protein
MRKTLPLAVMIAVVLMACGGRAGTERNMLEWGPVLNNFMATNMANANSYPDSLDELPPIIRNELKDTDGWGNKMLYRKLRIDLYDMISAGPDGEFGNDDDIIMRNGRLLTPADAYKEWPFKK